MRHRASVAYVREDGIHAHYSHWGALDARLVASITEDTPFGSDDPTPVFAKNALASLATAVAAQDGEAEIGVPGTHDTDVDADPYWIGDTLVAWAEEAIDFLHHECAYVVDTTVDGSWDISAYDTVWYREPIGEPDSSEENFGMLVELRNSEEWGEFAHHEHVPEDASDMEPQEWADEVVTAVGIPTDRIPSFSPLTPSDMG